MTEHDRGPEMEMAKVLDDVLFAKLELITNQINDEADRMSIEKAIKLLKRANALIAIACGDDRDLYEEWRYHMVRSEESHFFIFQGREIDVEVDETDVGED